MGARMVTTPHNENKGWGGGDECVVGTPWGAPPTVLRVIKLQNTSRTPAFVNSLPGTWPGPFIYVLPALALTLPRQG